ncbi:MAG: hypothetical protein IKC00_01705 [Clostridia bacterium]|nr:hypothetical protein [Clostridia bacterium]
MKEFVLSDKDDKIISIVKERLFGFFKTLNGNCEIKNIDGRVYMEISIPRAYSEYFKERLIEEIASNLLFCVKWQFYKDNVPSFAKKDAQFVLLHSLVFSDFNTVVEILKADLSTFNNFYLDGICNFLLSSEISEWEEIVNSIKNNLYKLQEEKEFKKYLKCITSAINSKNDTLYVIDDNFPSLYNGELNKMDYTYKLAESLGKEDLLIASILENFPQKLVNYSKNLPGFVSNSLRLLY